MKNKNTIHEQLLSPLNVITGFIQLFEMDDNLTTAQLQRIKEINHSIKQVLDIVNQLPELNIEKRILDQSNVVSNSILVVEDNMTNQELLLQQLEMLGYTADTANNGQEALDKIKQSNYPLILTDLNMPLLNGYQLTKSIRELELKSSQHSIIIAITANALVGEEEKCLQLGMDGYLSKPLNIHDLKNLLDKWNSTISSQDYKIVNHENHEKSIIDKSCLIRSIGNDHSKHITVLKSYLTHAPEVIKNLVTAYNDRDIKQVRFFSHKIKSSSYSIGAKDLADANQQIEKAADENNWNIIDNIAPEIEKLYKEAETAILSEFFNNKEDIDKTLL